MMIFVKEVLIEDTSINITKAGEAYSSLEIPCLARRYYTLTRHVHFNPPLLLTNTSIIHELNESRVTLFFIDEKKNQTKITVYARKPEWFDEELSDEDYSDEEDYSNEDYLNEEYSDKEDCLDEDYLNGLMKEYLNEE